MRYGTRRARKRGLGIRIVIILLIVAVALGVAAFVGWKVFVLERVDVVGNEIYSEDQIREWVLSDEHAGNTLYVVLKSKFSKQEEIPFVDSMEIKMVSPTEIEVRVTEKGVLGYLYIPSQDENAYFDQDGFVVELSDEAVDGVMQISGPDVKEATLYEKLDLGSESVLKTLLNLTQLLKKYDCKPNVISIENNRIDLEYDAIRVNLGTGTQLGEKILRLKEILPRLEGRSGTLRMDMWSESDTDIYFTPDG